MSISVPLGILALLFCGHMPNERLPETTRPKTCSRRTALLHMVFGCAYASALGGCAGKSAEDSVQARAQDEESYRKKVWWEQQGADPAFSGIFFRLSKMEYDGTVDSRRFTQEQWDSNERIAGWMLQSRIVDIMVWNDREHTTFDIYVEFENEAASHKVTEEELIRFAANVAVERHPQRTYPSEWKGIIKPVSGGRNRREVELRYEYDASLDAESPVP